MHPADIRPGTLDDPKVRCAVSLCAFWSGGLVFLGMGLYGAIDRSEIATGTCSLTSSKILYGCLSCCGLDDFRLDDSDRRQLHELGIADICHPDYGYKTTVRPKFASGWHCPPYLIYSGRLELAEHMSSCGGRHNACTMPLFADLRQHQRFKRGIDWESHGAPDKFNSGR
eukprot:SAG31_NODE_442_length_15661_cov_4.132245_18_plen_170_part_00